MGAWEKTCCVLVVTPHVGTSLDQLTVSGEADAASGWVAGEGRQSRNDAVGHQPQQQTVFTLLDPELGGVVQRNTKSGFGGDVVAVEALQLG